MALHFKFEDKTGMAFLANGRIGLGSLAVGLGCDPMGITVRGISLDYNPATGQSQTFGAVLQHLRQSDGLLGTCPENPIVLEGKALGAAAAPAAAAAAAGTSRSAAAAAAAAGSSARGPGNLPGSFKFQVDPSEGIGGRAFAAARAGLLTLLLMLVAAVGLVVVKGPPMSGKTSLMQQMAVFAGRAGWGRVITLSAISSSGFLTIENMLSEQVTGQPVTWAELWAARSPPSSGGGLEPTPLEAEGSGGVPVQDLVLILVDEAQLMMKEHKSDTTFWNNLKALQQGLGRHKTVRVILYALYGDSPSGVPSQGIIRSPFPFTNVLAFKSSGSTTSKPLSQLVDLTKLPVRNQPLQLALTVNDYEELWQAFLAAFTFQDFFQDEALRAEVYELAAGHVGLTTALLDQLAEKLKSCPRQEEQYTGLGDRILRRLFHSGGVYSIMQRMRGVQGDLMALQRQEPIMRAIWAAGDGGCSFQDISAAWPTHAGLDNSAEASLKSTLDDLYYIGVLLRDSTLLRYSFVTPLHYSYYLARLSVARYDKLQLGSLDEFMAFVRLTITRMSWRTLQASLSRRSNASDRVYERHYQVEWYSAAKSCLSDVAVISPDVGRVFGCKGMVDFWVQLDPEAHEGWAIELLVHGDRAKKHAARFAPGGTHTPLPNTQHAVIDFWLTQPKLCTDLARNYYVVELHHSTPQATLSLVGGAPSEILTMQN